MTLNTFREHIDMNTEEKTLWVAYTNSDLTEGRGREIPKHVCEIEATARRLAKGISVMASDGDVRPVKLLVHEGKVFAPYALARAIPPTPDDERAQAKADAKEAALKKAQAAGLTAEDIKALRG